MEFSFDGWIPEADGPKKDNVSEKIYYNPVDSIKK